MSPAGLRTMLEPEAIRILQEYGVPYPEHGLAHSAEEAVGIANRLGYPVVLKVVSGDVVHKSDLGGVVLGIENGQQIVRAYEGIVSSIAERLPGAKVEGLLVCRQAPPGLEVIVGAVHDAMFGPALMFGLGGVFAEVLRDVSFRVLPVERTDAAGMIREIQGYPLLAGTRGRAGYDIEALVELLLTISRMVLERPEIEELDLNPVRLYEQGLLALDARIMRRERLP
jgi:acyl-CoA synthetase (NDP forming)